MNLPKLPLDTWMVVEEQSSSNDLALVSRHDTQSEAERQRDRCNESLPTHRYHACMVVEPIAQRMGGRPSPTAS
jgi:hypothetical protein